VEVVSFFELDQRHVWHPYSAMPAASPPLRVVSAAGVRLSLEGGRELIDGMASWWCVVHGYRHPVLDAAVRDQLGRMAHVMFGGLTHEPAVRLAARLVEVSPVGLETVFFADSGSVAVEVAIKMCLQYWLAVGRPERRRLLTVRGGYHGDTFGAMAVCDPVGGMHSLFRGTLAEHVFVDRPPSGFDAPVDESYAEHVRAAVERHADELAAVIVEPVVQGAGGMHFYSPGVVGLLRELCDAHGLLLVLDEIATGFGRTGALFACEHAGVAADVMCVGKALTGGYMSLAATLCTGQVAEAISSGAGGALMHGPTYMANPLACAVALASLGLLEDGGWLENVGRVERGLIDGLDSARELPGVVDVRVLGAIGVVELEGPVDVAAATKASVELGVWLRPFRNLVYTMPPYITTDDEVARIAAAVVAATRAGAEGG
jgi:adenosylmethionine-8-amino-7-oxononanoate aminotransferase